MATEPPPSRPSRSIHIIVGIAVLLLAALGLSWFYLLPSLAPQTAQISEPPRATSSGPPSDVNAVRRAAEEQAAADQTAAGKAADEQAFAEADRTGTTAAFEAYIQKNPSGAHVDDARARLAALAEQSRRDAEARAAQERAAAEKAQAEKTAAERKANDDRAFAEATQAGTVAALENYIRNNAAGAHVADAQQHIATLNEQVRREAEARATQERAAVERAEAEARAADERAWVDAAQAGNAAALEAYVRDHPSSARVDEARQRIAVINEQARREAAEYAAAEKATAEKLAAERAADDRAFSDAIKTGTIAAYEAYIRDNASGAHVMEAAQRLAKLRAGAGKESARAKAASSGAANARPKETLRERRHPYVPQKPVYKAPPLNAAMH